MEDEAIAMVLHDVVEDCGGPERLDEIYDRCDKLHNLRYISDEYRSHGENLWSRFRTGRFLTL